jgi:nitroreductase
MSENRAVLDYLKTRRSVTLPFLKAPGPNKTQLDELLEIGMRVPDHGKLEPWRLVIFTDETWVKAGEKIEALMKARNPEISEDVLEAERTRFLPAPLTIGVISSAVQHPKIPTIEQQFSAACVCLNLVHAAHALGFGAHWVTRWFAFDNEANQILGAKEGEFFAGFIHVGTPETRLEDRPRPNLAQKVTYWAD